MQELWVNSTFWRIFFNCFAVVSIIFGAWLLFRLLKSFLVNKKEKRLMDSKFINIKKLPNTFTDLTQVCLVVNFEQKIQFNLLDENENPILEIHDDIVPVGEKIFTIDTNKIENGNYFILVKTLSQDIFRKIVINN